MLTERVVGRAELRRSRGWRPGANDVPRPRSTARRRKKRSYDSSSRPMSCGVATAQPWQCHQQRWENEYSVVLVRMLMTALVEVLADGDIVLNAAEWSIYRVIVFR